MRTEPVLRVGIALLLAIAARAQLTNFTIIDYPDASGTLLEGINDAGDVVGSYFDSAKVRHAFLLRNGRFTSVEVPGSTSSAATDINAAGDIVGFYSDASNLDHGFLLSGGRLTPIDYPGFERTRAFTINARGEIVGMAWNTSGDTMRRGFLLSNGRFTEICYPEAAMTMAFGINDQGEIVGRWSDVAGKVRGFLWRAGNFTSFEFPGAQITASDLVRITNSGEIVGPYTDARGRAKGFLLRGGRFTSFDAPGSVRIVPRDITNLGQVVGVYADSRGSHGMITAVAPSSVRQPVLVDDDNAECPGSLPTIQEAVRVAPAGATILVCRGIYTGSVNITGPEKNGLKLIAMGRTHEVVLQGDYAARDGFHLENVSDVLIRGFTVRDFGTKATSATEWGAGNLIYLENAHRNTIEQNQLFNSDRTAIMLVNSSNNIVQQNVASADNNNLATCGIEVQGAQSANNLIQLNMTHGNKLGGIRVADAGPGNIVQNNTVLANGRYGIDVQNSSDVWVEGNRISYNRGFWGTTPGGQQPGLGINLANLIRATIFDNRARGNSGADLNWDGKGENRIESNACENCVPASACQK